MDKNIKKSYLEINESLDRKINYHGKTYEIEKFDPEVVEDDSNRIKLYRKLYLDGEHYRKNGMEWPGFGYKELGKRYRDNCGAIRLDKETKEPIILYSKDKDEFYTPRLNCGKKDCPICWKKSLLESAEIITQTYKAVMENNKRIGRPGHWSISPPKDKTYTWNELKKERSKLHKTLSNSGLVGHHIFIHDKRICDDQKDLYDSIHFHVTGFGFLIKSSEFEKKYNMAYRFHGRRYTDEAIKKTLYYIMTHSAMYRNEKDRLSNMYVPGGIITSRYMRVIKEKELIEGEEKYYRVHNYTIEFKTEYSPYIINKIAGCCQLKLDFATPKETKKLFLDPVKNYKLICMMCDDVSEIDRLIRIVDKITDIKKKDNFACDEDPYEYEELRVKVSIREKRFEDVKKKIQKMWTIYNKNKKQKMLG